MDEGKHILEIAILGVILFGISYYIVPTLMSWGWAGILVAVAIFGIAAKCLVGWMGQHQGL